MPLLLAVRSNKLLLVLIFIALMVSLSLYSQGSVFLVGGGAEEYNDWSDEPYDWFVQQADSGKIINIDVSSASSWYPAYFKWLGADSTSHEMQIATRIVANDSVTYGELVSAHGIFIEGGDQWLYISTWKGTLVEDAIHYVFNQGGVIGGSSAGLAVLGEIVFDAKFGSAYPDVVACDPYNNRVSFTDDFLHILPNVLTDSHFHPRARLGRLIPMLARRIQDFNNHNIIGLGVDDNTAFCVNSALCGTVYGEGTVTIMFKSDNSIIRAEPAKPPTFTDVCYFQLNHSAVFSLATKTLVNPGQNLQTWPPPTGITLTYLDTILDGSLMNTAESGEIVIGNLTSNILNAWHGLLTQNAGTAAIPRSVIIPKLWNDLDLAENRLIGGMYGVATHPHFAAIYLDDNTHPSISGDGIIIADKLLYILDTHGATHSGFIQFKNTNYPGIIDARLHFLGNGDLYNLANHEAIVLLNKNDELPFVHNFELYQNFPNPFNSSTTFQYRLFHRSKVLLQIIDTNGEILGSFNMAAQSPGTYTVLWDASDFSSGVYFYRFSINNQSISMKCVLMK
jgi:cyanophycinase